LANATGYQYHLLRVVKIREGLTQRSPDFQVASTAQRTEASGHVADHQIDDIQSPGLLMLVQECVVEGKRPTQQRIVASRQTEHDKLTGTNLTGNFRAFQAQAIGVLGKRFLKDYTGTAEMGHERSPE
jgi:hypothetical protein